MKFIDFVHLATLNPKYRIRRHVDYLSKHIQITNETDKKNFERIKANFVQTFNRLTIYQYGQNISFILLYISAILAVTGDLAPWATTFLRPIGVFANIIGFGILTILFLWMNKAAHAVQADLFIEHAHLVAIAVKHNEDFVVHPHYKWGLFRDFE